MVCLYGTTLERIKGHVMATQNIDITNGNFADWNWLIHLLSKYIYNQTRELVMQEGDTLPERPFIPESEDRTPWARWFFGVLASLKKEFNDATPQLALKGMENPPTEEVAQIIYDATSLEDQMSFRTFLQSPPPTSPPAFEPPIQTEPINPANFIYSPAPKKASTFVTIPGVWQENIHKDSNDGLPALIPIIPPPVPLYKQKIPNLPPNHLMNWFSMNQTTDPFGICECDECKKMLQMNIKIPTPNTIT